MSQSLPDRSDPTPACVYLLADHLDAALAAGEDLVSVGQAWDDGDPCDPGVAGMQRWAIGRIRAHEMTLLSRILRARDKAAELAQVENRFKPLAHLFVSGTLDLADAVDEACDLAECAFENGGDATAYLRARGLLDAEAAGLQAGHALNVGDAFLVVGRLPLGILLDLVEEFIDALDLHFGLYPADNESGLDSASDDDTVQEATGSDEPAPAVDDQDDLDDADPGDVSNDETDVDTDRVEDPDDDDERAASTAMPPNMVLTVAGLIPKAGISPPPMA